MNRNVEIKARVFDLTSIRARAEAIADSGPVLIEQVDTFFEGRNGRLKLREFPGENGELIYYDRPDSVGPTESQYIRAASSDPGELREALSRALGVKAVVRKRRTLYLTGQTRIHLDEVEGLGQFVELEVVLRPEQSTADGIQVAEDLMEKLGITSDSLLDKAYVDLL